MSTNLNPQFDRFIKFRHKYDRLSEGNKLRLEQFADSMLEQQQGKRQQRAKSRGDRFPVIDNWRVGE